MDERQKFLSEVTQDLKFDTEEHKLDSIGKVANEAKLVAARLQAVGAKIGVQEIERMGGLFEALLYLEAHEEVELLNEIGTMCQQALIYHESKRP